MCGGRRDRLGVKLCVKHNVLANGTLATGEVRLAKSECQEAEKGDGVRTKSPAEVAGARLLGLLLLVHDREDWRK